MIFEEYAVPALLITFTLGILLGINLGMLCIPRFFEPNHCQPAGQNFLFKPQQQSQQLPPVNPLRYPSGFSSKQLQQQDFIPAAARRAPAQPLGANLGRRVAGISSFSY